MHGGGVVGPARCAGGNDLPLAAHGPAQGAQDHRGPPRPLARPAAGRPRPRQTPPRPPAADAAGEVEVPHPEALPAARPNLLYRGVVMTGRPARSRRRPGSSPGRQAEHHSAYRSRSARIEYPWHPLHGRRLRVCQRAVRGGSEVLSLEDRPGLTRELPAWRCDAATCLAMTLGPPLVRVDALSELAATLAALAHDPSARPSSTSSLVKEALDAATDGALANTTHAAPGTRGGQAAACRGVEGAPAGPGRPAPGRPGRGPDRSREEGGR